MAMPKTYSTYEAKAKFSEILRKVRGGESVYVSYRGEQVAEIRPIEKKEDLETTLERLREDGILSGEAPRRGELKPIARRPGALKRFLESRD